MIDNQKKLSRHEMGMAEGVRAEGDNDPKSRSEQLGGLNCRDAARLR
jgi:hypothetical protein